MPDDKTKKLGIPNDPLVLYVEAIEFEPDIHTERRKLTVDVEIPEGDVRELIKKLTTRMDGPVTGAIRVRFVGRPV